MEYAKKPVQARAQKTRENLLKAALAMYEKKGYHKTTVDDIAAEAGVSTGIAYRYFRNKKDMLLSVIAYGADHVASIAEIDTVGIPDKITDVRQYLEAVLQHTDEDVRKLYSEISDRKMNGVIEKLAALLHDDTHIREKAYAAIGIMEQHCHLMMHNALYHLDADVMRGMTVSAVLCILKGAE